MGEVSIIALVVWGGGRAGWGGEHAVSLSVEALQTRKTTIPYSGTVQYMHSPTKQDTPTAVYALCRKKSQTTTHAYSSVRTLSKKTQNHARRLHCSVRKHLVENLNHGDQNVQLHHRLASNVVVHARHLQELERAERRGNRSPAHPVVQQGSVDRRLSSSAPATDAEARECASVRAMEGFLIITITHHEFTIGLARRR